MLMLIFGIATVYSVAFNPENPNIFSFDEKYGKQILWLCVSLFLGLMVFLIDSDIYRKFAFPIYLFVLSLLVLVLFMPPINGARAWIGVGSMGIQPAEFGKIAVSLLLAKYISELSVKQQTIGNVVGAAMILLVPMVLILLQPDAGSFVVFTSFLFVMYREGLTFDPIILSVINSFPGVKMKYTWVGSHFIPILFVAIFLSVITLLLSSVEVDFFFLPSKVSGETGVIVTLILFAVVALLIIRQFGTKRDRSRGTLIIVLGLILGGGLSFGVGTGLNPCQLQKKVLLPKSNLKR